MAKPQNPALGEAQLGGINVQLDRLAPAKGPGLSLRIREAGLVDVGRYVNLSFKLACAK